MRRALTISHYNVVLACLSVFILLSSPFFYSSANGEPSDCWTQIDIEPEDCADETMFALFDTIPPRITVPPDIKVVAESAPIHVDIGKAVAKDFADPVPVVTNNAPKNMMFPFGTTMVKWKAVDFRGNVAFDYQFVTVVKHPSPTLPFKPATGEKQNLAALKLDPLPYSVPSGNKVLLTGKLIDSNTGEGVKGVNVNILDNRPLDKRTLGIAKTDDEGKFNFIWYTSPTERGKDRLMSIIAKFDGTSSYANTISPDRALKVEVKRVTLDLIFKKQNFGAGERVIVLAAVKTFGDKLIEPDELEARFDGKEVSMVRKATGIYQFMSLPDSTPAPHLFTMKVVKLPSGDMPFGSVVKSLRIK
jgi:hypothetical protein